MSQDLTQRLYQELSTLEPGNLQSLYKLATDTANPNAKIKGIFATALLQDARTQVQGTQDVFAKIYHNAKSLLNIEDPTKHKAFARFMAEYFKFNEQVDKFNKELNLPDFVKAVTGLQSSTRGVTGALSDLMADIGADKQILNLLLRGTGLENISSIDQLTEMLSGRIDLSGNKIIQTLGGSWEDITRSVFTDITPDDLLYNLSNVLPLNLEVPGTITPEGLAKSIREAVLSQFGLPKDFQNDALNELLAKVINTDA